MVQGSRRVTCVMGSSRCFELQDLPAQLLSVTAATVLAMFSGQAKSPFSQTILVWSQCRPRRRCSHSSMAVISSSWAPLPSRRASCSRPDMASRHAGGNYCLHRISSVCFHVMRRCPVSDESSKNAKFLPRKSPHSACSQASTPQQYGYGGYQPTTPAALAAPSVPAAPSGAAARVHTPSHLR